MVYIAQSLPEMRIFDKVVNLNFDEEFNERFPVKTFIQRCKFNDDYRCNFCLLVS